MNEPIVWTRQQWLEYQENCRMAGYTGLISGVLAEWTPEDAKAEEGNLDDRCGALLSREPFSTTSRTTMKPCPRAPTSSVFSPITEFKFLNRPDDGTCDYCGSLDGDVLMARLEAGDVILVPSDKDYKTYARNNGGAAFRQTYRIDSMEERRKAAAATLAALKGNPAEGDLSTELLADVQAYERGDELDARDQRHWKWTTREMDQTKFYFDHLSEEQRKRFVELLNAKRIKLDVPGYFYRLPFFVSK